jgi:hypothetical protein
MQSTIGTGTPPSTDDTETKPALRSSDAATAAR